MKLSKRLQTIADMVDTSYVIDVGCDHALLDVYLASTRNITCLACDISENALQSAKENITRYHVSSLVDTKCTDGLQDVFIPDDTTVVIAGMGAVTALDIVRKRKEDLKKMVISVHSDVELFRREMVALGYFITSEKAILEKQQYYVIFSFQKGVHNYEELDYEIGPFLKKDKDYVSYLIQKLKRILISLPKTYVEKRNEIEKKIENYQSLL